MSQGAAVVEATNSRKGRSMLDNGTTHFPPHVLPATALFLVFQCGPKVGKRQKLANFTKKGRSAFLLISIPRGGSHGQPNLGETV